MRINDPSVCSSSGTLLQAGTEPVAKIYLTRDGEEMGRTRARGTEQAWETGLENGSFVTRQIRYNQLWTGFYLHVCIGKYNNNNNKNWD